MQLEIYKTQIWKSIMQIKWFWGHHTWIKLTWLETKIEIKGMSGIMVAKSLCQICSIVWSPGFLRVNRNRYVYCCCNISQQEKLLSSSLRIQTGWCIAEVISRRLDLHLFSAVCRSGLEIKITAGMASMARCSEKQKDWCVADRFLTNEILQLDIIPLYFSSHSCSALAPSFQINYRSDVAAT